MLAEMRCLLGVDGGGTKTDIAVAAVGAETWAKVRVGGSSLSRRPATDVQRELTQGVKQALTAAGVKAGECVAVCAGFASAGSEANQRVYGRILATLLPRAEVQVITDAELAWRGASGGADGVVVIAGTGSIAWGCHRGRRAQAGGAGPGKDPGSGDWIGRQAVAAGLHEAPEDGNYAGLLPALAGKTGLKPILAAAGDELARLVEECAAALAWPEADTYAVGGVFQHFPAVREALARRRGRPLAQPQESPISAALALAGQLRVNH